MTYKSISVLQIAHWTIFQADAPFLCWFKRDELPSFISLRR